MALPRLAFLAAIVGLPLRVFSLELLAVVGLVLIGLTGSTAVAATTLPLPTGRGRLTRGTL